MDPALTEHQLAEVFVCCHQQRAPIVGLLKYLLVGNAGGQLGHVENIMAVASEPFHHRSMHPFVREEVHADGAPTG